MRTVLSHYQTLLDDYRAPGGSFPETMNSAPHRGFLGDHRCVSFVSGDPCALVSDTWPGTRQIPLLGPVTGRHWATGCARGAHGTVRREVRERPHARRRGLRSSLTQQVTLFGTLVLVFIGTIAVGCIIL
jgi:hypothetical protein